MVRVHRAVKRPTSTASSSRKQRIEEVSKTLKRKKDAVDESKSKLSQKSLLIFLNMMKVLHMRVTILRIVKGKAKKKVKVIVWTQNYTDASNDNDLHERVAMLEKSVLDIAFFVRDERLRRIEKNKKKQQDEVHLDSFPHRWHKVNLKELAVVVTDIAAADEKAEKEKKKKKWKRRKQ
ncbi:hypothetical protein FXO37_01618 [Capsicum annuum]|nr:hypothetical protein FXO37_01618 [Capsicum annuum]